MEIYLALVATLTLAVSCATLVILHLSVRPEQTERTYRPEPPPRAITNADQAWAAKVVDEMEANFKTVFSPERRAAEIQHLARTRRA